MAKKVFYDDDARQRVLGGAKILYDAVKTTLGPKGRNAVIGNAWGNPTVTKDGVTVAKAIDIKDEDDTLGYKIGVELIKQAASKMGDNVGDGTTSVTVLTYHILNEANKLIAAGHNPNLIRKGLEEASTEALAHLDTLSEDIKSNKERVVEIGTISATDASIGKLIAGVMDEIGKDGVVTVEAGQGLSLESDVVEGYTFDRGFVSPYMVTDTTRMEAVYNKPAIVITDKKVSSVQEIVPLLEKLAQAGRKDLVIIAEDVDGEAMGTLILNKLKGVFNTVAIKSPSYGELKGNILADIATLTGATIITADQGVTFENADLDMVGSAAKVIVTKDETTIIEGVGGKTEVKERIADIDAQLKAAKTEYDKENLTKRRAALEGKVAVIKVGGATETEINEKKDRVDDAVAAVKAALSGGIVAGGGVTLLNIASAVNLDANSSVLVGKKLFVSSLEQPFNTLLQNSGLEPAEWLPQVKKAKAGQGIDVTSNEVSIIDLKEAGIIDPTKVTREVVQNAVSIAGTTLTMGALVVDIPEEEPAQGGMPQMPMM